MSGTYIYIDGLNFYYGAVKGGSYKWVDLEAFARLLVPQDQITRIRYFTAPVKPHHPGDKAHERQNAYIRALRSLPSVDPMMGHFLVHDKWRALADKSNHHRDLFRPHFRPLFVLRMVLADAVRRRAGHSATMANVVVPEEKGSDVNLATYLIYDALNGDSDKAIVVSNDSDLTEAVRLAVAHGIPVGIVNPHQAPTSGKLKRAASFEVPFRRASLAKCQLPNVVRLPNGKSVTRPLQW